MSGHEGATGGAVRAPSNRELAAEAKRLGEQLGEDVVTERLNKAALTALVEELRARAAANTEESDHAAHDSDVTIEVTLPWPPKARVIELADDAPATPSAPITPAPRGPYSVAAGHSITTRRGILPPGAEVRPTDFAAGEERLAHLVRVGVVVKR